MVNPSFNVYHTVSKCGSFIMIEMVGGTSSKASLRFGAVIVIIGAMISFLIISSSFPTFPVVSLMENLRRQFIFTRETRKKSKLNNYNTNRNSNK